MSTFDKPYTEDDEPRPEDAYGVSKLEAENMLRKTPTGMQTVVLRPPLIYGAGVKGNFLRLMRAVERGLPLPLASIRNRRSLTSLNNLIDAIIACLDHPAAAGQTYLVADDRGIATPELVRAIATAMQKPACLLPFPPALLRLGAAALGRSAAAARLTGSLEIDSSKLRRELGWQPGETLAQGLTDTAEWYYQRPAALTRN
jgi:nucleoside-diphosphate-sugar epimerase